MWIEIAKLVYKLQGEGGSAPVLHSDASGPHDVECMTESFSLSSTVRHVEPRRCNGALYKPAYQVGESTEHGEVYPAFLANDGSRISSVRFGSCAVSGYAENPWWVVDLSYKIPVEFVLLTSCKNQLWRSAVAESLSHYLTTAMFCVGSTLYIMAYHILFAMNMSDNEQKTIQQWNGSLPEEQISSSSWT